MSTTVWRCSLGLSNFWKCYPPVRQALKKISCKWTKTCTYLKIGSITFSDVLFSLLYDPQESQSTLRTISRCFNLISDESFTVVFQIIVDLKCSQ